jgi:maltose phosphorylase
MESGTLTRKCGITLPSGNNISLEAERFISMDDQDVAAISYSIDSVNWKGKLHLKPFLDFDVVNADSNYDEKFWDPVGHQVKAESAFVQGRTKKTAFEVSACMCVEVYKNGERIREMPTKESQPKYVNYHYQLKVSPGDTITLIKYLVNTSSLYIDPEKMQTYSEKKVSTIATTGYTELKDRHAAAWATHWEEADIRIEGDTGAQQGIRFNIFQLLQTYTGEDARLNIGPKGFTGEKYGGSTYWDTEAYCVPFYLGTCESAIAKNLILYRYFHLSKAIENAEKLGFSGGAALYPMVTMNGEECHNEWEITFEEIHRNGAIAYAIFDYMNYTGDEKYLIEGGLEVLTAIARFWVQRVNFSLKKQAFVMLGVTGPNEYENNVNNNWYTNYIARWCLQYATTCTGTVQSSYPEFWEAFVQRTNFMQSEIEHWMHVARNIYLPEDEDMGLFLQQDNYLDKEQVTVKDIDPDERPINQYWSWDRILRSPFIKQADVLQGIYFFEDDFDVDTIKRNFLYYEARTVHESSLSPCVHAILACKLDMVDKAYEMYLRTSRLDLDDYNNDTEDGCHITSMAGTWMSIVKGFGGQRVRNGQLSFSPKLPPAWKSLSFRLRFRKNLLEFTLLPSTFVIRNLAGPGIEISVFEEKIVIPGGAEQKVNFGK